MKHLNILVIETDKKNITTIRHLTDTENFKHVLSTFCEPMSQEEIDDMFEEFEFDDVDGEDGLILTKSIVSYEFMYNIWIKLN